MRIAVIIGCGSRKAAVGGPAHAVYTGSVFAMHLTWARSVVPQDRIFIVSARYGLIRCDHPIDPYELRLGQPGSVTASGVRRQASRLGILFDRVIVLAGADYAALIREAFGDRVRFPVEGQALPRRRKTLKTFSGKAIPGSL